MKILHFVILFELLILSVLIGFTYSIPYPAELNSEQNPGSECTNYEYTNPQYDTDLTEFKEGELYGGLRPNLSVWADAYGVRPYKVRTNSDSLRNEEISAKKPKNTIRILLLGDSLTFGWGVNRSDTYAELLEEQLNKNFTEEIEVINTGVPSYGMKDYYKTLKHKGLNYNPEMVIIGYHFSDWYSHRYFNNILKTVNEKIDEENMSKKETHQEKKNQLRSLLREEYENTSPEETDLRYVNHIYNITQKRDISLILYDLTDMRSKHSEYLKNWSEKRDARFLKATKYQDADKTVWLSEANAHPDPCGHELLKKDLYPAVRKSLLNSTNMDTSQHKNSFLEVLN